MEFIDKSRPLVVVTGATYELGTQICRSLAQIGYNIIAQYNTDHSEASDLRQVVRGLGGECLTVAANLGSAEGIGVLNAAVDTSTVEGNQQVHALVNNVALTVGPSLKNASMVEFDRYVATNLRAPFFLAQSFSQRMGGCGVIINVSSPRVTSSGPDDVVYVMAKSAIEAMTRHAAHAFADEGVRINSLIPADPEAPAPRQGDPMGPSTRVAEVVRALISGESVADTGQSLDLNLKAEESGAAGGGKRTPH